MFLWHHFAVSGVQTWPWLPPLAALAIPGGMVRYGRENRLFWPLALVITAGGAFMVPICLAIYRLPVQAIAGATLTATFLTSAIALAAYAWLPAPSGVAVRPDRALGLALGVGGLAGSYLGPRMQKRVPQRGLKGALGLLLLVLALRHTWPG